VHCGYFDKPMFPQCRIEVKIINQSRLYKKGERNEKYRNTF
jgi:hypothetical protein